MTRKIRPSRLLLAGVAASALLLSACGSSSTSPSSLASSKTFGSIVMLYVALQRYYVQGLISGAVKG
jgi:ABC-type glycerol-3-phosphate transport system permease component